MLKVTFIYACGICRVTLGLIGTETIDKTTILLTNVYRNVSGGITYFYGVLWEHTDLIIYIICKVYSFFYFHSIRILNKKFTVITQ